MKKTFIVLFMMSFLAANDVSARRQIDIHQNGQMPSRIETIIEAEMPSFYYDSDAQEIIIETYGNSTYYEVEIISCTTLHWVYYDRIKGMGDVIDISFLPEDNYIIIITSSDNNVYEGYFSHTPVKRFKIAPHGNK
ncbi:MAG: hypothetical protein IKT03_06030 [Muribaculaceae bacterium]|nr:hypothetical protein [Muribaculaceae bacterium]